jgi:hypothetical protein
LCTVDAIAFLRLAFLLVDAKGDVKAVFDHLDIVLKGELVANKLPTKDEKASHRHARAVLEFGTVGFSVLERKLEVADLIEKRPELLDVFRTGIEKRSGNKSAIATSGTIHCRQYLCLQCLHLVFSNTIIIPRLHILVAPDGGGEVGELVESHDAQL